MDPIKAGAKVYFMGIAGTGMAAVAGLMQEAGYQVSGSDQQVYPPMSTMLDELKIPYKTPYAATNISKENADVVVVANCLSRGHEELESLMDQKIPYTSFPEIMGECFLKDRLSLVVTGTHGKTTTSSILTHVLRELGEKPGYMIGGVPKNFEKSFHLGEGAPFVVEGDEYDTAWFDKESKFLHYHPNYLIFNNLEFDHADIFKDLAAIEKMFSKFLDLAPKPSQIIANIDDPGVCKLLKQEGLYDKVTKTSFSNNQNSEASIQAGKIEIYQGESNRTRWKFPVQTKHFGEIIVDSLMIGMHNMANICQVIGCLNAMAENNDLATSISAKEIAKAFFDFQGVQRRFDLLGSVDDIEVFEDFAHHPTAVGLTIDSFRKSYPDRRLFVAFEPRNATARRNTFEKDYAAKLMLANQVLIGKCPVDTRIPVNERMNIGNIQKAIGSKAESFAENEDLLDKLVNSLKPKDSVIFMSSGSFSGVQYKLLKALEQKQQKL